MLSNPLRRVEYDRGQSSSDSHYEEERRKREEAEASQRRVKAEQQRREQAKAERRHTGEEQRRREEAKRKEPIDQCKVCGERLARSKILAHVKAHTAVRYRAEAVLCSSRVGRFNLFYQACLG